MTYRCFSRVVWRKNESWPNGYEPQAVPMDQCRTLAVFDTREEAIDWCEERNAKWRRHSPHSGRELRADSNRVYHESPRYEWEGP